MLFKLHFDYFILFYIIVITYLQSDSILFQLFSDIDRDFVLKVVLAGAFYPNYFVKRMQNSEIHKENIIMSLGSLDPMKTVYLRGWPIEQPGYLYAKKFQEIFAKHLGIPEKQIAVFFDKSKRVYVQFHEKAHMNDNFYNISNFVYQVIINLFNLLCYIHVCMYVCNLIIYNLCINIYI